MRDVSWRYFKHGSCAGCDLDDVRLYTPQVNGQNLPVAAKPAFCVRCREKFERVAKDVNLTLSDVVRICRCRDVY